jgi:hypothetical protein
VATPIELSGISVVCAGFFNPAIFQPRWLVDRELITENAAEDALDKIHVTPELSVYTADWLSVQVTLQQAVFATVEEGREFDLRDLVKGVFELLPETPVNAVGINADAHFRVASEAAWHEIGDRFLPKDFWEDVFVGGEWRERSEGRTVGLRTLTVEATREDLTGYVRTEVAPSARVEPNGVYVGVNAHFQLSTSEDERGNGYQAARIVEENWDATRSLERQLVDRLLEAA